FNRPGKANAIGVDWPERITRFLREVEHRPEVRAVLFRAVGKHFQAGGDLEAQPPADPAAPHLRLGWIADQIQGWNVMLRTIMHLPKPVVASIQGGTVGASLGLLGACDLVIAADDAWLWLAQGKNGFTLDGMPSFFLPRLLGTRKAMEWVLLAPRVPAEEARRLGLINFVVPRADLEAETAKLMDELARGPTRAHGLNKALVNAALDNDFDTQAGSEMDTYMIGAQTNDWFEGSAAFREKRAPKFTGT
ncbi:MAG TPA: enoyl-CoA hydratase-related protein, partial [Stellaceae bacterium]|nr:enoyl-CoA hydratase-related protein [Stellaceae bacterium]